MADVEYRPRGERASDDLRQRVATLLERLGPRHLARRIGVSRDAVLGVAAGMSALPGTLALLRERLPQLEAPTPGAEPQQ
jgi:hypothetical protein